MHRSLRPFLALALLVLVAMPAVGQNIPSMAVDSLMVVGNSRLTAAQITGTAGLVVGVPINYRDIQRAITNLVRTGQFDNVSVEQRGTVEDVVLVFVVVERPLLCNGRSAATARCRPGP